MIKFNYRLRICFSRSGRSPRRYEAQTYMGWIYSPVRLSLRMLIFFSSRRFDLNGRFILYSIRFARYTT
jgi:hypothetical protein